MNRISIVVSCFVAIPLAVSAIALGPKSMSFVTPQGQEQSAVVVNARAASSAEPRVSELDATRPNNSDAADAQSYPTPRPAMGPPESFPYDGVYIWCDPDEMWTVLWKGDQTCTLRMEIASSGEIIPQHNNASVFSISPTADGWVVNSTFRHDGGVMQFQATQSCVTFRVFLAEAEELSSIFVGRWLATPQDVPVACCADATQADLSFTMIPQGVGAAEARGGGASSGNAQTGSESAPH